MMSLALWKRGQNVDHVERSMQIVINEVENGEITVCRKKKPHVICFSKKKIPNIKLKLYDQVLTSPSNKVLGGMDGFKAYIYNTYTESERGINILRCLEGVDWDAARQSLKRVYCALIRPIIDYGSKVYSSASVLALWKIGGIQSQKIQE